jgi:hypothetical protein
MWEGTTSRVMAADRPYYEFYGFYRVSPEYFVLTLVRASQTSAMSGHDQKQDMRHGRLAPPSLIFYQIKCENLDVKAADVFRFNVLSKV